MLKPPGEAHVPRILQCGHFACQGCYNRMLRPVTAEGNVKRLACPVCRKVTAVKRGQAGNLPKPQAPRSSRCCATTTSERAGKT